MWFPDSDKVWLERRLSSTNKAMATYLKSFQSTPWREDLAQPTKTTEPTLQCVVEMGRPTLEASSTVQADPISMVKPEEAVTLVRSSPMVWMTRRPHTHRPTEMPSCGGRCLHLVYISGCSLTHTVTCFMEAPAVQGGHSPRHRGGGRSGRGCSGPLSPQCRWPTGR